MADKMKWPLTLSQPRVLACSFSLRCRCVAFPASRCPSSSMDYIFSASALPHSASARSIPIPSTHLPALLQKSPQRSRRRPTSILVIFHRMSTLLQLLHLGHHRRLVPFLVRARDGAFVGDEFVELATDGGRVIVAGNFPFDFFEFDGAPVSFLGGRSAGGVVRVDVLFVGRAVVSVFRGGFGVGCCSVGGGAGATGATGCFGHCFGWLVLELNAVFWVCKKMEEKVDVCCSSTRFRLSALSLLRHCDRTRSHVRCFCSIDLSRTPSCNSHIMCAL